MSHLEQPPAAQTRRIRTPRAVTSRARSADAKADRRAAILGVARLRGATMAFADLTMHAIAADAGVTKGTLYLYFPTKEHLFLALLDVELAAWFDIVDPTLTAGGRWSAERAIDVLADSLVTQPLLTRLLAILEGVLERNIDLETAIAFKERLLARTQHTATLLERCLPQLSRGDGLLFLLQVRALLVGLQLMCEPSPIIDEAFAARPALAPFQLDFATQVRAGITALLRGTLLTSSR
jgi:AcrR family transcriptional regulator